MPKSCLECGEKIIGREDKKFCSDGCRNAYNNKINKDSNNLMRNINNKLRKNYRILSEINTEGKTKTSRSKLLSKGFDFEFFTSVLNTKTGNTYYFLYDQGYLALENDFYMLVKKDI
jgi:predicted nucleic acid-binding Zn ribbon protein